MVVGTDGLNMRILFSIPSLHKGGGGIVEVVPREAEELLRLGHEVCVVLAETADYSDAAVHAERAGVKMFKEPIYSIRGFGCLHVTWKYCHDLSRLIDWADIVHINCLWMDASWMTAWMCRWKKKPYLLQTHGALNPAVMKKSALRKWLIGNLIERANLNHANAVVATAESEKQAILDFGIRAPVKIVPIGLDSERFIPSTKETPLSPSSAKHRLLYFSRVSFGKGLDMLADAWKCLQPKYPDWELVVTGPDDRGYTQEIQRYIASIGLSYKDVSSAARLHLAPSPLSAPSDILFTGPVYGDDKYTMLQSADVFVLPTRSENWSIAVAEAMAAGLPVVCTKGAPWSCINECGCGHWVDVSTDAIATGLEAVMSLDDESRTEMGRRGRRWVEGNLVWATIASNVSQCYEAAIKHNG